MARHREHSGPRPGRSLKTFSGEKDARDYLRRVAPRDPLHRAERTSPVTDRWEVELRRIMDVGDILVSNTANFLPLLNWLMSGNVSRLSPPPADLPGFIPPPEPLPEGLQPLARYFHALRDVYRAVHTYQRLIHEAGQDGIPAPALAHLRPAALVAAAEELGWRFVYFRHVCEELGLTATLLRRLSGQHQVLAAFAYLAQQWLQLDPPLGPKDLEALMQLQGLRPPEGEPPRSIDFTADPKGLDLRRRAWVTERKEVKQTGSGRRSEGEAEKPGLLLELRDLLGGRRVGQGGLEIFDPRRHRIRRR